MKKIFLGLMIGLVSFTNISWNEDDTKINISHTYSKEFRNYSIKLYDILNNRDLNFEVFEYALKGYTSLVAQNKLDNSKYLTIIDMSLSSKLERLFIIDMINIKIVHKSIVAHGENTGLEYATHFSNKISSHQTSLGFYKTAETYFGKHGLSLRLDGLEFSNNNARRRAIVMHSADYASKEFIKNNGRLGRSFGCPSIPEKNYKEVIQKIKKGSALFIYHTNKNYLDKSTLINSDLGELFEDL
ncbi:MAG: murein L,D-transpeptidase catalytic domain family protein [Flavobacteriaceae bacterium]|nr:murein L,D-transpeptidase catalytic domain family protein [Flavobacteriaceae bacterium]